MYPAVQPELVIDVTLPPMTFEPVVAADSAIRRPTYAEIDLEQLSANYRAIERAVGNARMLPVLKANAYGHGLVEIARHLETLHPAGFGVAFLEEAILLRGNGISVPILVMGGLDNAQIPHFLTHGLTITASSVFKLREIERVAAEVGSVAQRSSQDRHRNGENWRAPLTRRTKLFSVGLASPHVDVAGRVQPLSPLLTRPTAAAQRPSSSGFSTRSRSTSRAVNAIPDLHIANSGAILQHPPHTPRHGQARHPSLWRISLRRG